MVRLPSYILAIALNSYYTTHGMREWTTKCVTGYGHNRAALGNAQTGSLRHHCLSGRACHLPEFCLLRWPSTFSTKPATAPQREGVQTVRMNCDTNLTFRSEVCVTVRRDTSAQGGLIFLRRRLNTSPPCWQSPFELSLLSEVGAIRSHTSIQHDTRSYTVKVHGHIDANVGTDVIRYLTAFAV